jgi:hypothetical protein
MEWNQARFEGLGQIDNYMQRVNATEGHLILFDQRPDIPWDTKFSEKAATTPSGRSITVWSC